MGHGVLRRTANIQNQTDKIRNRVERLERRYRFPIGFYEIKCFADRNALDGNLDDSAIIVSVGDGKFLFPIPKDLDLSRMVEAEAGVSVGSASDLEIDIGNCGSDPTTFPGTTMLTGPITISGGDFVSWTPGAGPDVASPWIDDTANQVISGDWISVNVVDAGDDLAEGLVIILQFVF